MCANCHSPYPAGHSNCPAAPCQVRGHIIKPTKTEIKATRCAGKIAQQHLYRTVEESRRQATLQPETTPLETSETESPRPSTQRQVGEDRTSLPTTAASYTSSSTASREKRPRRAATGQRSLNVGQLSAGSIRPQPTIHTDPSTSEREDASMSDDPPSSC